MFDMDFMPLRCKTLFEDLIDPKQNLVITEKGLGSCISPGGCVSDEVPSRIEGTIDF